MELIKVSTRREAREVYPCKVTVGKFAVQK